MPRLIPFRLAAACTLALLSAFSLAAVATAKGPTAELHVVGKGGKVLADTPVALGGKIAAKARPAANCFGPGSGGSGKSYRVGGATALGLLVRAATFTRSLRPLLLTDAFVKDFGLGVCGIGGTSGTTAQSWYLKVNHKTPSTGGEGTRVKRGDEVLWGYGGFPYPAELALVAPNRVAPGKPFAVRVFAYDEKGKRSPVSGARVSGASGPTDQRGRATVTLSRPARLIARHGKDTPSSREPVCVGRKCPGKSGR